MTRATRSRRSCLAVPASSTKMVAKAPGLPADEVFLDLEDACAPAEKVPSRARVVAALTASDWGGKVRSVRINAVSSPWCLGDVTEVVLGAGRDVDCLMLPKVEHVSEVHFVDHLLGQLEQEAARDTPIGLELVIESPAGVLNLRELLQASPRIESVNFGVGDYAQALGLPQFDIGMADPAYPGHQWHWAMSALGATARAHGVQAIDGPFVDFRAAEGYAESCTRALALGFEGKWCIHPSQIELANEAFAVPGDVLRRAEELLERYDRALADGHGAIAVDGKLVDEATRKMAERAVRRGRAQGPAPARAER